MVRLSEQYGTHRVLFYLLRIKVSALLSWPFFKLFLAASDLQYFHGMAVYVPPTGEEGDSPDEVFRKIQEGFGRLRRYDARGLCQVQRYLARVVVRPCRRSHYSLRTHSCVLTRALVLEQSPEKIAMSLLHEAMHARINRVGIPYMGAVLMNRIEQVCVKAELDCVYKLAAAGYNIPAAFFEEMEQFAVTGIQPTRWQELWLTYDKAHGYEPSEP